MAITGNTFLKLSGHAKLKIVVNSFGRNRINLDFTATFVIKLYVLPLYKILCSKLQLQLLDIHDAVFLENSYGCDDISFS